MDSLTKYTVKYLHFIITDEFLRDSKICLLNIMLDELHIIEREKKGKTQLVLL